MTEFVGEACKGDGGRLPCWRFGRTGSWDCTITVTPTPAFRPSGGNTHVAAVQQRSRSTSNASTRQDAFRTGSLKLELGHCTILGTPSMPR